VDIYKQIMNCFSGIPCIADWREVQTLFHRIASKKPYHWMLPVWACEAVGGTASQAIPAAVSIACSQISIILVDDMLDSDPRGEFHSLGEPATANMACAFQAAGLAVITQCKAETDAKLAALSSLDQMTLITAFGQYQGTQCVANEADYWRIVQTKSSPFFGSALHIGALLGGGSLGVVEELKKLGQLYGEMIQIHDDLNDALEVPANPDWLPEHNSLPILFAETVEHPDKQRFGELRREAQDPKKLAEAQAILIRCGAISYGIDQLIQRYQKCREILDTLHLINYAGLDCMLEKTIQPIKNLFESLGSDQSLFSPISRISNCGTSGGSNPI